MHTINEYPRNFLNINIFFRRNGHCARIDGYI